ncbi:biotin carboxylase N-terminal domain-containing protein [Streptomyces sp. NPDC101110]|uniref:biotin carboxylase N-terminal domain-containing protein n=1 Tax=Streptomyces sp. NPDC101110 TaxID=3366104 RepID=UPI0037FC1DEA
MIAVRVIRAAHELDLPIVALRSRDEANALHARMTDEVVVFDGEESGGQRSGVRAASRSTSLSRRPLGARAGSVVANYRATISRPSMEAASGGVVSAMEWVSW